MFALSSEIEQRLDRTRRLVSHVHETWLRYLHARFESERNHLDLPPRIRFDDETCLRAITTRWRNGRRRDQADIVAAAASFSHAFITLSDDRSWLIRSYCAVDLDFAAPRRRPSRRGGLEGQGAANCFPDDGNPCRVWYHGGQPRRNTAVHGVRVLCYRCRCTRTRA